MLKDPIESLEHYFRIQNKYFVLQEQVGLEAAKDRFTVDRNDLLAETAKFETGNEDALSLNGLLDLIDRYVFMKTHWHGDINLNMEVALSGKYLSYF